MEHDFEELVQDALDSLPPDLRAAVSNVEVVVEDEPPDGRPLLAGAMRRANRKDLERLKAILERG